MSLKLIIFDFDGVIVNSYKTNYEYQARKFPGLTKEDHSMFFEGNVHEKREQLISQGKLRVDERVDLHTLMRNHFLEHEHIPQEVFSVLKKLHAAYSLAINSSFVEKYINEFLEKEKATYLFSEVMGIETHKKKSEKFKLLSEKQFCSLEDCLFVTDTLGDIKEANEAGVYTIALDCGFHSRRLLLEGNPYAIVSSFEELYDQITNYDFLSL